MLENIIGGKLNGKTFAMNNVGGIKILDASLENSLENFKMCLIFKLKFIKLSVDPVDVNELSIVHNVHSSGEGEDEVKTWCYYDKNNHLFTNDGILVESAYYMFDLDDLNRIISFAKGDEPILYQDGKPILCTLITKR